MRKILAGCILLISTALYSSADALSTLKQLEVNFQQLEIEETAMYNQRKAEAEEAERALISLRAKYRKLSETEKYITEVRPHRYYKKDYKALLKRCKKEKEQLKNEISKKEDITDIHQEIM